MKLVLQCAMCGTHHPVGTPYCTTCHASGVNQMRLMLECPTCGSLGIKPVCESCPLIEPLELDDELIVAEEVTDDALSLEDSDIESDFEDDDFDLDLDLDEEEDEAVVVDVSDESIYEDEDFDDSDEQEEDDEDG